MLHLAACFAIKFPLPVWLSFSLRFVWLCVCRCGTFVCSGITYVSHVRKQSLSKTKTQRHVNETDKCTLRCVSRPLRSHVTHISGKLLMKRARSRIEKGTRRGKTANFVEEIKIITILKGLQCYWLSIFERAKSFYQHKLQMINFSINKTQSGNYRTGVNMHKMGIWKTKIITSFDISYKTYCFLS